MRSLWRRRSRTDPSSPTTVTLHYSGITPGTCAGGVPVAQQQVASQHVSAVVVTSGVSVDEALSSGTGAAPAPPPPTELNAPTRRRRGSESATDSSVATLDRKSIKRAQSIGRLDADAEITVNETPRAYHLYSASFAPNVISGGSSVVAPGGGGGDAIISNSSGGVSASAHVKQRPPLLPPSQMPKGSHLALPTDGGGLLSPVATTATPIPTPPRSKSLNTAPAAATPAAAAAAAAAAASSILTAATTSASGLLSRRRPSKDERRPSKDERRPSKDEPSQGMTTRRLSGEADAEAEA